VSRPSRPSPGGVGDGLPALPSGEPVLHRWFVLAMIVLVVAALVVTVWAFMAGRRDPLSAAERRPVGTSEVTHERGQAALADSTDADRGPGCAVGIDVVGDEGGRAAGRRALAAVCHLLESDDVEVARVGLRNWIQSDGVLRVAVFELTGLDSSARVEDGRVVIEINAKFQFEDAARAAPVVLHELVHLGQSWPGSPVGAEDELAAITVQAAACDELGIREDPPRGCLDSNELLGAVDPLRQLLDAGYGSG
jgi:hypothetical protein